MLSTQCGAVDSILGGGVRCHEVTEVCAHLVLKFVVRENILHCDLHLAGGRCWTPSHVCWPWWTMQHHTLNWWLG